MATPRRQRSRQGELFARSTRSTIEIDETHRLVLMTHEVDWTELEEVVQGIRMSKLKSAAGRPPRIWCSRGRGLPPSEGLPPRGATSRAKGIGRAPPRGGSPSHPSEFPGKL
jgi:hypothetical protein